MLYVWRRTEEKIKNKIINQISEFAFEAVEERIDKPRTPGSRYGDWHVLNILDNFYSDSQSLRKALEEADGTRVSEALNALRGGDCFPEVC